MSEQNIYLPHLMTIEKITNEAPGVKTFKLKFQNEEDANAFSFKAGQFGEYSAFGEGESTFCIASSPMRKGYIECTFRVAGKNTTGLAALEEGSTMLLMYVYIIRQKNNDAFLSVFLIHLICNIIVLIFKLAN